MLHCYGENSFTFLLFQELNKSTDLVEKFISNLKSFKNGNKFNPAEEDEANKAEPQIWLFPSFGKQHGFGEPDAVVLYRGYSFWIEVETNFNLRNMQSAAQDSIKQLIRFNHLNQAIRKGKTLRPEGGDHLAWVGLTIKGKDDIKKGVLRAAGHSILTHFEDEIRNAVIKEQDHYVLLSEKKMVALTKKENNKTALHSLFEETVNKCHQELVNRSKADDTPPVPDKPQVERFWYQYYESDMKNKVVTIENDDVEYIRIRSA